MATSTRFHITTDNTGLWEPKQTDDAASTVSRLLQQDLQSHDAFFNMKGFHNHIAHQLLSLYGTGAPADAIEAAYECNKRYQQPAQAPQPGIGAGTATGSNGDLQQKWFETTGIDLLGRQAHYADFLRFFQCEISAVDGDWQSVVVRYLLDGTSLADNLLVRLYSGILHPLIQLQYGLEWDQPAAVAQALAQTCVHEAEELATFLLGTESAAAAMRDRQLTDPPNMGTILDLYRAVAANPTLAHAIHVEDTNTLYDSVLGRAPGAIGEIASRVHVPPTEADVAERTAEMAEACVYVAAAAAVAMHPHKRVKFDFFLIHHITPLPFFLVLMDCDWVPTATKARLLEWKIRLDLTQYAARACPPLNLDLSLDKIRAYRGRPNSIAGPPNVTAVAADAATAAPRDITPSAAVAAARLFDMADDDGHAIKLVRATGLAEQVLWAYDHAPWRVLQDPYLWQQIYRMEVDSVKGPSSAWVRTTGLKEAWTPRKPNGFELTKDPEKNIKPRKNPHRRSPAHATFSLSSTYCHLFCRLRDHAQWPPRVPFTSKFLPSRPAGVPAPANTGLPLRSIFLRKNYAMLTVVFGSAFAFQSFYDITLNRVWDNVNRGRQWKDIRSRYIESEDDEE